MRPRVLIVARRVLELGHLMFDRLGYSPAGVPRVLHPREYGASVTVTATAADALAPAVLLAKGATTLRVRGFDFVIIVSEVDAKPHVEIVNLPPEWTEYGLQALRARLADPEPRRLRPISAVGGLPTV